MNNVQKYFNENRIKSTIAIILICILFVLFIFDKITIFKSINQFTTDLILYYSSGIFKLITAASLIVLLNYLILTKKHNMLLFIFTFAFAIVILLSITFEYQKVFLTYYNTYVNSKFYFEIIMGVLKLGLSYSLLGITIYQMYKYIIYIVKETA